MRDRVWLRDSLLSTRSGLRVLSIMNQATEPMEKLGGRKLKSSVLGLLGSPSLQEARNEILRMPLRRIVNPLISCICSDELLLRHRAAICLGDVLEELAESDRESARIVMRRLMWHLNDESGGIGWGATEAMAEAMVRDGKIAEEYASILVSYLNEEGNFLEHEPLQRGLLWAVSRVAGERPELFGAAADHLAKYLEADDPAVRGLAARAVGVLRVESMAPRLWPLLKDEAEFAYYDNDEILKVKVSAVAEEALEKMDSH